MTTVKLEQVKREDLGPLAEQLSGPFEVVSRFMRQVANVLNGGLLFRDNAACVIKEVTLEPASLPAIIGLGSGFQFRPAALLVVKVNGSVGVGNPAWEPYVVEGSSGAEQAVRIHDVPGLTPGVRCTMTLMVLAG